MGENPRGKVNLIGLRVADRLLWLDARDSGIDMAVPARYEKFVETREPDGGLVLRVQDGRPPGTDGWQPLYYPSDTWELWRDEQRRYVFVAPRGSLPRRHAVVDAGLTQGQVIGEFSAVGAGYPLDLLDILVYLNWIATSGDVILHAAAAMVDGQGVCFSGLSGAGKSTLTRALIAAAGQTRHRQSGPAQLEHTREWPGCKIDVLAEDNVVLRCMEGQFWIYGTPWHLNPDMCSPFKAPLAKVFFLDRGAPQGVTPCRRLEGVTRLLQAAFVPYYRPEVVPGILDRLARLAEHVPFYTLNYRLGADVGALIRAA